MLVFRKAFNTIDSIGRLVMGCLRYPRVLLSVFPTVSPFQLPIRVDACEESFSSELRLEVNGTPLFGLQIDMVFRTRPCSSIFIHVPLP